ncbi:MAG: SDR family oxidoreductase [Rhodobiaceae bacterium]|nr:SDR family oxidoreductase [Rhodobiaceae bacterium]
MDLGIAGRNAVVCASSRGLGRACAEALAEAGCRVVVNGLDADRLKETAREIADAYGAEVIPVAGDVSLADVQDAMIAAAGAVDILVNNNAGPPFSDFRDLDREAMLKGCVQNMVTPIELIQKVIDGMAERGFGRIVNITSGTVKQPIAGLDLSSGARAGLTAFVAGVTPKYLDRNVTINHLLPGMFATDRLGALINAAVKKTGQSPEEVEQERRSAIPARRFGQPEEFGKTCAFLCSAYAGYIANQNVLIDGGRYPGCW